MEHSFESIVLYANSRPPDPVLEAAVREVEGLKAKRICYLILKWLKDGDSIGEEPVLLFGEKYEWQRRLPGFVSSVPALNELFEVDSKQLKFRSSVPAEIRDRIRQYVRDHYSPTTYI